MARFFDPVRDLVRRAAGRIRSWALAELGAGRLIPWIAIAFGCGILVYFSIDQEPAPWATLLLLCLAVAVAVLGRRHFVGLALGIGLAALVAGFATATIKRAVIAHPVLLRSAWNVELAGFVEAREERERSDRIILRVVRIAGTRQNEPLERVRFSVRKGTAPAVGTYVEFKARLSPPLPPLRPGGYDFARDMYFQRLGASGFVLGKLRTAEPPHAHSLRLRYSIFIDSIREAIDKRIRAVLPGDRGSIASALITGKRDAISSQVNEAMYVSGLAHVLSISGYHMAVVAGLVFFAVRALFLPWSSFANRHPTKKWAALAALLMSTFYLLLSGAEVATQRSYIMIGIVLLGVLVDRAVLTFRTLTVAALGVLLLAPEAIVHPSFQMSFAATLALIAGYQLTLGSTKSARDTPLAARLALWGGREIVALIVVSLLAGTATIPLRRLSFSPRLAIRRAGEPRRDAGRLRLGDAVGHCRPPLHAARARSAVLAADGVGHRLDDGGGGMGRQPAWIALACACLRWRSIADLHAGHRDPLPAQDSAPVCGRVAHRGRDAHDGSCATTRSDDRR
jgi:competence protein ComEC